MSDAITRYRELVAKHPGHELARFSLGKALYDRSDWAGALEQFEAALGLRSDWMAVRILAGRCRLALGDRAGARAAFEAGLRLAIEQHHEGPQAELESLLSELK